MQILAPLFIKNDPYRNQGEARFPVGQKNMDGYHVLNGKASPTPPRKNTGNTIPVR